MPEPTEIKEEVSELDRFLNALNSLRIGEDGDFKSAYASPQKDGPLQRMYTPEDAERIVNELVTEAQRRLSEQGLEQTLPGRLGSPIFPSEIPEAEALGMTAPVDRSFLFDFIVNDLLELDGRFDPYGPEMRNLPAPWQYITRILVDEYNDFLVTFKGHNALRGEQLGAMISALENSTYTSPTGEKIPYLDRRQAQILRTPDHPGLKITAEEASRSREILSQLMENSREITGDAVRKGGTSEGDPRTALRRAIEPQIKGQSHESLSKGLGPFPSWKTPTQIRLETAGKGQFELFGLDKNGELRDLKPGVLNEAKKLGIVYTTTAQQDLLQPEALRKALSVNLALDRVVEHLKGQGKDLLLTGATEEEIQYALVTAAEGIFTSTDGVSQFDALTENYIQNYAAKETAANLAALDKNPTAATTRLVNSFRHPSGEQFRKDQFSVADWLILEELVRGGVENARAVLEQNPNLLSNMVKRKKIAGEQDKPLATAKDWLLLNDKKPEDLHPDDLQRLVSYIRHHGLNEAIELFSKALGIVDPSLQPPVAPVLGEPSRAFPEDDEGPYGVTPHPSYMPDPPVVSPVVSPAVSPAVPGEPFNLDSALIYALTGRTEDFAAHETSQEERARQIKSPIPVLNEFLALYGKGSSADDYPEAIVEHWIHLIVSSGMPAMDPYRDSEVLFEYRQAKLDQIKRDRFEGQTLDVLNDYLIKYGNGTNSTHYPTAYVQRWLNEIADVGIEAMEPYRADLPKYRQAKVNEDFLGGGRDGQIDELLDRLGLSVPGNLPFQQHLRDVIGPQILPHVTAAIAANPSADWAASVADWLFAKPKEPSVFQERPPEHDFRMFGEVQDPVEDSWAEIRREDLNERRQISVFAAEAGIDPRLTPASYGQGGISDPGDIHPRQMALVEATGPAFPGAPPRYAPPAFPATEMVFPGQPAIGRGGPQAIFPDESKLMSEIKRMSGGDPNFQQYLLSQFATTGDQKISPAYGTFLEGLREDERLRRAAFKERVYQIGKGSTMLDTPEARRRFSSQFNKPLAKKFLPEFEKGIPSLRSEYEMTPTYAAGQLQEAEQRHLAKLRRGRTVFRTA